MENNYLNFKKKNENETELFIYGNIEKKTWIDNWLGTGESKTDAFTLKDALNKVDTKPEYLERIQTGFISVMKVGLGKRVMGNSPNPAGKTGTSESFLDTNKDGVIDTPTLSQSFVGYAPSNNPKMTITVVSPDVGFINNTSSDHLTYVNRLIAREISNKFFEMFPSD